jgi:hypothetical protein
VDKANGLAVAEVPEQPLAEGVKGKYVKNREAIAQAPMLPMTKRVALVGHSPSTRDLAPYDDPSYEIWTMNDAQGFLNGRRATRWFEIHIEEVWREPTRRLKGYLEHLQKFAGPIYMDRHYDEFPTSVEYPFEHLFKKYGRGKFGSSFSYLFALAIEEGFTEIEMYGCDLASEEEYKKQRESTAFWIGYCKGAGIRFALPAATPILTAQPYGRGRIMVPGLTEEAMSNHISQLRGVAQQSMTQAVKAEGKIEEAIFWRAQLASLIEQK